MFLYQLQHLIEIPSDSSPIKCIITSASPTIPKILPIAIWLKCSSAVPASIDLGSNEIGNLRFFVSEPNGIPEQKKLNVPSFASEGNIQIDLDHPYKKRINLASIEPKHIPTILEISLAIVDPKDERQLFVTNSVSVTLSNGQRSEAAQRCNALAQAVLSRGLSTSQMLEVEDELASVHDPLAIPALKKLLDKGFDDITLINGLQAIGTKEARDILFDYAHKRTDPDDARYALAAIKEMDRVGISEASPVDPNLPK